LLFGGDRCARGVPGRHCSEGGPVKRSGTWGWVRVRRDDRPGRMTQTQHAAPPGEWKAVPGAGAERGAPVEREHDGVVEEGGAGVDGGNDRE
jgi:hypothetical protein